MQIDKSYPVLVSEDVETARAFYERHLGLVPGFVTEWFVYLVDPSNDAVSIGIIDGQHDSLPSGAQVRASGVVVSLEVPDVDDVHDRFGGADVPIEVPIRDEPWGQRHFMVRAPDGVYLDVISMIRPSAEFVAAYETS